MMVLDATKKAEQRALLEAELEAVGIRLNREPPYAPKVYQSGSKSALIAVLGTSTSKSRKPAESKSTSKRPQNT